LAKPAFAEAAPKQRANEGKANSDHDKEFSDFGHLLISVIRKIASDNSPAQCHESSQDLSRGREGGVGDFLIIEKGPVLSSAKDESHAEPAWLQTYFLYIGDLLRLGLVLPVAAQVKELLHFTAFIPAFVGFIRAIRQLSERVLGIADHLEH
jgi:hypothetical protein